MKAFVKTTFHFRDDGPGEAPSESGMRSSIEAVVNLLAIGASPLDCDCTPQELRAVKAMTEGFTFQQFVAFARVVKRAIEARRARHAGRDSFFSRVVIEDLSQIEKRADLLLSDIATLLVSAERVNVTGMEPSRTDLKREGG